MYSSTYPNLLREIALRRRTAQQYIYLIDIQPQRSGNDADCLQLGPPRIGG